MGPAEKKKTGSLASEFQFNETACTSYIRPGCMAHYSYPENTERRNPLKYGEFSTRSNKFGGCKTAFGPCFTRVKRHSENEVLFLVKACAIGFTGRMLRQSLRRFSRPVALPLPRVATTNEQKGIRNPLISNRLLNFAGGACLLGAGIGILRATEMERAVDIVICLVGSLAVCCCICYLWFTQP